ncbi:MULTISPECIES: hypothetical protein [unclassified Streptomyces]|uniref:hypothetical protein n=1 Tax=unclassified Streptomyces TaxID=2593676 RepID=UPI0035E2CE79
MEYAWRHQLLPRPRRDAPEALITAKADGKAPPEVAEEGESAPGSVLDLMAALNASVKKAMECRGEGERATVHEMKPRKKAAVKKAPAKKATEETAGRGPRSA